MVYHQQLLNRPSFEESVEASYETFLRQGTMSTTATVTPSVTSTAPTAMDSEIASNTKLSQKEDPEFVKYRRLLAEKNKLVEEARQEPSEAGGSMGERYSYNEFYEDEAYDRILQARSAEYANRGHADREIVFESEVSNSGKRKNRRLIWSVCLLLTFGCIVYALYAGLVGAKDKELSAVVSAAGGSLEQEEQGQDVSDGGEFVQDVYDYGDDSGNDYGDDGGDDGGGGIGKGKSPKSGNSGKGGKGKKTCSGKGAGSVLSPLEDIQLECGIFGSIYDSLNSCDGPYLSYDTLDLLVNSEIALECPCPGEQVTFESSAYSVCSPSGSHELEVYRQYCLQNFESVNEADLYHETLFQLAYQQFADTVSDLGEAEELDNGTLSSLTEDAFYVLMDAIDDLGENGSNECLDGCAYFVRDVCCMDMDGYGY